MTIRQLDTWVLDAYLTEAGWDGQHEHVYFTTRRDAEEAGRLIAARMRERVGEDGDQRVDWSVFKAVPFASFHRDPEGLKAAALKIANEWLEGLDLDDEDDLEEDPDAPDDGKMLIAGQLYDRATGDLADPQ